jgi:hypothetical protein
VNSASETDDGGSTEFELRTRELLRGSAERLSGATRSRLTQARYAALAAGESRTRYRLQRWAPAGAAAAALALLVVFVPHGMRSPATPVSNGALEDLDLLASDVPLNSDQDMDYEFYEWAVDQAQNSAAPAPRPPGTPSAGV